jgi:hypothetical protein
MQTVCEKVTLELKKSIKKEMVEVIKLSISNYDKKKDRKSFQALVEACKLLSDNAYITEVR